MKRYIITIRQSDERNAGPKARRDIETLAASMGFEAIAFQGERTADGSIRAMLGMLVDCWHNWCGLSRKAEQGGLILIQYPHYPIKTAFLTRWIIPYLRWRRHFTFVALIHDLDSLRGQFGKSGLYSDHVLLRVFDRWICHNERMKAWMVERDFPAEYVVPLKLFDYLADRPMPQRESYEHSITIAGNLEKSAYLYAFAKNRPADIPLHLYGPGYCDGEGTENVVYHGTFTPEELPGVLEGGFGLVWDGDRIDTCSGSYGEYLRINDPHKVSLYLASGMPLIIWRQAALADWLASEGLGLAVDSLKEAIEAVAEIDETRYSSMCQRCRQVGEELRIGANFRNAIHAIGAISNRR